MNWFKRDSLVGAVVIGSVLALTGEAWLLRQSIAVAHRELDLLGQKRRERAGLEARSPVPTGENEEAILKELAAARARLASAREGAFGGLHPKEVRPPDEPPRLASRTIDAYFDISALVGQERALAEKMRVSIRADERFGFAAYAREGPAADLVPAVLRQRRAIHSLLEILFAARPASFTSIRREHPVAKGVSVAPGKGDASADFFVPPKSHSLRIPGQIESDGFELEFTGQTRVLRAFISRLAAEEMPFAVRSVEVEPLSGSAPEAGVPPANDDMQAIVARNLSRFRVTVEFLTPVPDRSEGGL